MASLTHEPHEPFVGKKRKVSCENDPSHSNQGASSLSLTGRDLTIEDVHRCMKHPESLHIQADSEAVEHVSDNRGYLEKVVGEGKVIYGINTGYGGSADVRSSNLVKVQEALVTHLNAGFGRKFEPEVPRAVMMIRANCLLRARSGVRPDVIQLLLDMLRHDIVPQVPVRGSVSASGDLMPTSYIAAAMMGAPNAKVLYKGCEMAASEALTSAGLEPITFQAKEALAVVNSSSFAAAIGSSVLIEAERCLRLTQISTAMAVEALKGRTESFHPIMHENMAHPGQVAVARNILTLLNDSQMARQQLEMTTQDTDGDLKQDRYALRTSAQWLAPAHETLIESRRRVTTDINSTNDNPMIDHQAGCILHGGNFQGVSSTVAMDQARQAVQLCGKLLFAQMSEMVNVSMNQGLPPNLAASDHSLDFGFKGADTATASYMSELDWLTPPLTNHVLSAEIGNQSVNSMALVSARRSQEAVEVLCMILSNTLTACCQAIELRWLQTVIQKKLKAHMQAFHIDERLIHPRVWPWYLFAFTPEKTAAQVLDTVDNGINRDEFVSVLTSDMDATVSLLREGKCTQQIKEGLGKGTKLVYSYLRETLRVHHFDGQRTLDSDLQAVYTAIRSGALDHILNSLFIES